MSKTCGKCGFAAPDDQAVFCNRCGAAMPEEKKPAFPVCPGCGAIVSDELAQFCNRCGSKMDRAPAVCRICGSPALDSRSLFCTRCGATFGKSPVPPRATCPSCGAPDKTGGSGYCNRCGASLGRTVQGTDPLGGPVVITPRKSSPAHVTVTVPESEWEPWNDVPYPGTPSPARPAPAPEPKPARDRQIDVREKRYSHLPLVADEMKKKSEGTTRLPARDNPGGQKKRAGAQKKGVLGFLKK